MRANSKRHYVQRWTSCGVSHLFQLFRVAAGFPVCLLISIVNLRVHAVNAFCPLPIDHSSLLLTASTTTTPFRERINHNLFNWQLCAHTFYLGYDLLLCVTPFQTSHMVWSATHTSLQCWGSNRNRKMWSITTHPKFTILISILFLPVVDYLNSSILFNPEFSQDDVMYTAHRIHPCICFFMPVIKKRSQHL